MIELFPETITNLCELGYIQSHSIDYRVQSQNATPFNLQKALNKAEKIKLAQLRQKEAEIEVMTFSSINEVLEFLTNIYNQNVLSMQKKENYVEIT